jgi:hypothetical protein
MRHPWRSFTLSGLFSVIALLALFASAALAAPPQDDAMPQPATGYACDGGDGVYLYEDIDYGGACIRFTGDDPELGDDGWHDRASSVKFVGFMYAGGRARATLCTDAYYGGACLDFGVNIPWLGDSPIGNDSADSIRIVIRPFCDMVTQIPKSECEALVALYNSTLGPYWTNRTGWLANYTPCSWYGVACYYPLGDWAGHVAVLDLPSNNLTGNLPASLGNFSGLLGLDLNGNDIAGSIPSSIGNLSHLEQLGLWGNQLTGNIPASLTNLPNLWWVDLSYNQLTGIIPSTLGNLPLLHTLILDGNLLTGSVPDTLGDLPNLASLYVEKNPLMSGPLPQSLKNSSLVTFFFANTGLCEPPDAAFQSWLAGIPNLKRTGVLCAPTATPTRTATRTPTRTPTRLAPKRAFLPIIMKQRVAPGPTATRTRTATRTATRTRTPTRTPTPGALIFSDDFNDGNLAGWTAQGGTWTNPNTYMRGASNGTYAWNMRAESGSNVVFEGTVNLLSGKGAGIIARASADGTESYLVLLNAERNAFELWLNHEGWIFGSYPMTVQYNHPYHLKMVLNGNYLEGYLDGVRRMYGTYDLHSSGQFGTFIWNGEAAFDNVKAWSIP